MARLGLGWDALHAANPRLVLASISGYGQTGAWANRRAYAVVIHAEMGLIEAGARWRADAAGTPDAAVAGAGRHEPRRRVRGVAPHRAR